MGRSFGRCILLPPPSPLHHWNVQFFCLVLNFQLAGRGVLTDGRIGTSAYRNSPSSSKVPRLRSRALNRGRTATSSSVPSPQPPTTFTLTLHSPPAHSPISDVHPPRGLQLRRKCEGDRDLKRHGSERSQRSTCGGSRVSSLTTRANRAGNLKVNEARRGPRARERGEQARCYS